MERKSFGNMQCPVARTLERVGEWWSILILRDALQGLTRFDQFQKSLDIAPNMLTRRLHTLVDAGMLERRQYNDRPPRFEYVLTDLGRDFRSIIIALNAWGNKHFAPEGPSVMLVDTKTGKQVDLALVDRNSGREINARDYAIVPGPQADSIMRERLESVARRREAANEALLQEQAADDGPKGKASKAKKAAGPKGTDAKSAKDKPPAKAGKLTKLTKRA
ncbi:MULTISPECIES: helix-turn-helix domain-containing protein [unclassified Herbaspirillum]|uniref:winged helix-turn-helix transcriptional regulator n=1 Tax=unclassified Herbaspirillum TaxID=2624150 RepID=UPI001150F26A|nr:MULTISPECIES: helix-turn-helix domain-containing protein [unclassified Herbaspirillum]MBB5390730.1 DNA-binding HxlR family transcriptional regulator [Herbaspirillum sp. SJZ102]TQK08785.1 HxlR family transcriptional regulator [Herbaspirillum sp. SJZ130]TQK14528.1 HxlR family transcriptional regulator [Herbaspirillum sp. SJZ106]TWC66455.1 HxlR family transcriptional regulator [Herbaspirillum sp. SJZ099]